MSMGWKKLWLWQNIFLAYCCSVLIFWLHLIYWKITTYRLWSTRTNALLNLNK